MYNYVTLFNHVNFYKTLRGTNNLLGQNVLLNILTFFTSSFHFKGPINHLASELVEPFTGVHATILDGNVNNFQSEIID